MNTVGSGKIQIAFPDLPLWGCVNKRVHRGQITTEIVIKNRESQSLRWRWAESTHPQAARRSWSCAWRDRYPDPRRWGSCSRWFWETPWLAAAGLQCGLWKTTAKHSLIYQLLDWPKHSNATTKNECVVDFYCTAPLWSLNHRFDWLIEWIQYLSWLPHINNEFDQLWELQSTPFLLYSIGQYQRIALRHALSL